MNTKKPKQDKAPAKPNAFEEVQEANPELTYHEVQDLEQSLVDFLELCNEAYWHRAAEGHLPWPIDGSGSQSNSDANG